MLNDLEKQLVKIHLEETDRSRAQMIHLIEKIKPDDVNSFLYQNYQGVLQELKNMTDEDFKIVAIQLEFFEENT